MLQSFLIIKAAGQTESQLSSSSSSVTTNDVSSRSYERPVMPEAKLSSLGYRTAVARREQDARTLFASTDAVVLSVPASSMSEWLLRVVGWRAAPIFWWCADPAVVQECQLEEELDGILFPSFSPTEFHWTLLLGTKHYLLRTGWQKEREQLIARLEERKWIDRAKAILCEIKKLTEAEAYEFLRKQAMNDRKRVIDVATSIVRVYDLLRHVDNKGGRIEL